MFFNIGVEIGQLLFIATVLAAGRLLIVASANRVELQRATIVPAYLIGGVASYWTIDRLISFWV